MRKRADTVPQHVVPLSRHRPPRKLHARKKLQVANRRCFSAAGLMRLPTPQTAGVSLINCEPARILARSLVRCPSCRVPVGHSARTCSNAALVNKRMDAGHETRLKFSLRRLGNCQSQTTSALQESQGSARRKSCLRDGACRGVGGMFVLRRSADTGSAFLVRNGGKARKPAARPAFEQRKTRQRLRTQDCRHSWTSAVLPRRSTSSPKRMSSAASTAGFG